MEVLISAFYGILRVFKNLHPGMRFLDTSGRGRTAHEEFENSHG